MRNLIYVFLLLVLVSCNKETKFAEYDSEKKNYDVVILSGQSNMSGKGLLESIEEDYNFKSISYIHNVESADTTLFGPELGIAKVLDKSYSRSGKDLLLLKFAVPGANIDEWIDGDYYVRMKASFDSLNIEESNIRAFVWMQGESNARDSLSALNYDKKLSRLIKKIRQDAHNNMLPVILGRILVENKNYAEGNQIREVQRNIAANTPNTFLIDTKHMHHRPDGVHLSSVGQQEFGEQVGKLLHEISLKKRGEGDIKSQ